MKTYKRIAIGVMGLSLAACGGPSSNWLDNITGEGVFVTRSENEGSYVTILKLKTPALFESAKIQNGQVQIDPSHLALIEKEQEAVIKELQALSPDIKIIFQYRRVLNGIAIFAPSAVIEKAEKITGVDRHFKAELFAHPLENEETVTKLGRLNSAKFIGADKAHARGIKGQNISVGIIDTGIDYTHKMFNGEGTPEAYKAIDPRLPTPAFPNSKVVGGIDLAGSNFHPSSQDESRRIPQPDENPIDEATHGTHVAGTVAGIGDNVLSHDGVAPDALLHAIKVFSPGGPTSDFVVIAGLEYAADPNNDYDFSDKLDVVNLSLGAPYGNTYIMYNHAIRNLVRSGTVVVAAAGNNGDTPFVTGSPAVVDEAISVAASIDNSEQNTQFPAIELSSSAGQIVAEAIEGDITKKLSTYPALSGEVVYIGLADQDPSPEAQKRLKGQIALADRGGVAFADKIAMAVKHGAVGIIVANNAPNEAPIVMGGEGRFEIAGVMISKEDGDKLKALMGRETVVANLKSAKVITKSWLVDTITDFSSKGPRSVDGAIKPEISAPGNKIVSASATEGDKAHMSNGTSMAAPHIAGVAALLLSHKKELQPLDIKSLMMTTSRVIDNKGERYPVSRQGAGRVQIEKALDGKLIANPSAVSLGITDIDTEKTFNRKIVLKNISSENLNLTFKWKGSSALRLKNQQAYVPAGASVDVTADLTISTSSLTETTSEVDGFIEIYSQNTKLAHLPVLAVVRKVSAIQGRALTVHSSGAHDSAGSKATFSVKNTSANVGYAYPFIKLAADKRKVDTKNDIANDTGCDLQSAGYRILERDGKRVLQVALKLYDAQTTWNRCELNMQLDANGDGITDQELVGTLGSYIPGVTISQFASILLDGNKARKLRQQFEEDFATNPTQAQENYSTAVVGSRQMFKFDLSTLTILEVDTALLMMSNQGEISVRISTTHNSTNVVEYDDYLAKHATVWEKIPLDEASLSYSGLPLEIEVPGKGETSVEVTKGFDKRSLILYMPDNRIVKSSTLKDSQSQVLKAQYKTTP